MWNIAWILSWNLVNYDGPLGSHKPFQEEKWRHVHVQGEKKRERKGEWFEGREKVLSGKVSKEEQSCIY